MTTAIERRRELGPAFSFSADIYDFLYRNRDYGIEARFVDTLVRSVLPDAESLLDLGCGTGRHGEELTALGYRVTGIDASEAMLHAASARNTGGRFYCDDIRNFALDDQFDVIVSLFHVFGYLAAERDLERTLMNAARHLREGGVLIFDAWHGPGVMRHPPEERSLTVSEAGRRVTRMASPTVLPEKQRVEVRYDFLIETEQERVCASELHSMRYYFNDEVQQAARAAGLRFHRFGAWLTDREANDTDWNAYWLFAKK